MGLRQHSASLLHPPGTLHPRMGLVVGGFGQLGIEVKSNDAVCAVALEALPLLGWSPDSFLLARPRDGRWPAGTLQVEAMSYGDHFGGATFAVGDDALPPAPTFDFKPLVLKPPSPPSGLGAGSPPPFYVPAPSQPMVSLGNVTGAGPLVELSVFLSSGQVVGGWTPSGAWASAQLAVPEGGVTIKGAIVRDLLGQLAVYGEVDPGIVARRAAGLK